MYYQFCKGSSNLTSSWVEKMKHIKRLKWLTMTEIVIDL